MKVRPATGLLLLALLAPVLGQQPGRTPEKLALIRSLIMPGWGQHYLGASTAARTFATMEAALWLGYAGAHQSSLWYRQDYRAYAARHAGVAYESRSRPSTYYFHVGEYASLGEYNQEQLRSRKIGSLYTEGGAYDWEWDDPAHRERYVAIRETSLRFGKAASFIIGSMVVNRVISAIHVLYITRPGEEVSVAFRPLAAGGRFDLNIRF